MYSWELEQFIKERDFNIGGDDLAFLIDANNHPQINYIAYNSYEKTYMITTDDNYCFYFKAMLISEAKEKDLVKQLIKK